jgi:hypothetical protein
MAFNCVPCTFAQRKAMHNNENDMMNVFRNSIHHCKYIVLLPGEFIVFRQYFPHTDTPHQGVGYLRWNARIFMYWDLKGKFILKLYPIK